MANSTKTKVPLNINWDTNKKVWHIMVLSEYVENNKETLIASCQYHQDKGLNTTVKVINDLHRDWFDNPMNRFPDGYNFKTRGDKYPDLNFKDVCSTCVSNETTIEDFKVWLITQKLKHL